MKPLFRPQGPVPDMKRYSGFFRDTWLFWIVLNTAGIVAGYFVSGVFFSTLPISVFAFVYFGLMRYDENGQHKERF